MQHQYRLTDEAGKSSNYKMKLKERSIMYWYCKTNIIHHSFISRSGPAHKKSFTVCLKLGDSEEYIASGPSIKKAQHAAAAIALEKTSLKHPPPKTKTTKNGERNWFD